MTTSPLRFEVLLERHHDEIFSYLWRLIPADAEDLTQEVFLRAYQAFERLQPDSNARAWLYKIATNCAYTVLQRRQRQGYEWILTFDDTLDVPDSADRSPHQQAIHNETMAAVRQAIAGLPAKQQAAVVLRHVQGLEYAEIAQALGCSEDSARANVYQGIRRLRQVLKDELGSI